MFLILIKKHFIYLLFFIGIILLAWIYRPYPALDRAKIHPLLRRVDFTDSLEYDTYGDGGSLGILIYHGDEKAIEMCLSNSLDQSFFDRGQLYIGSYFSHPESILVTNYDHTRFLLASMLLHKGNKKPGDYEAVALLTGRTKDWIRCLISGLQHRLF
jgi:hypothetical protein